MVEKTDVEVLLKIDVPDHLEESAIIKELISKQISLDYIEKEQAQLVNEIKNRGEKITVEKLDNNALGTVYEYVFPTTIFMARSGYFNVFKWLQKFSHDIKRRIFTNALEKNELIIGKPESVSLMFSKPKILINGNSIRIKSSFLLYPHKIKDLVMLFYSNSE